MPGAFGDHGAETALSDTSLVNDEALSMLALTAGRRLRWPLLPLQHIAVSSLTSLLEDDAFKTHGFACDSAATGSLMLLLKDDALVTHDVACTSAGQKFTCVD